MPIISNDSQQQIGYVRITQSLDALARTFHQLDIGLISGMIISLAITEVFKYVGDTLDIEPNL